MKRIASMKRPVVWTCYGIIVFNSVLAFFIADMPVDLSNLLLPLLLIAWLFISLLVATTLVIVLHRHALANWTLWLGLLSLMLLGGLVFLGTVEVKHPGIGLICMLMHLFSMWAMLVAGALVLFQRDIGIAVIAWTSIMYSWAIIIAWRLYGNLFDIIFSPADSDQFVVILWLYIPAVWSCCFIPLGLISFVFHTVVLCKRELQQQVPPQATMQVEKPCNMTTEKPL